MTDEKQGGNAPQFDPRAQQNLADRFFPGPTRQMSAQNRKYIEELIKSRTEARHQRGDDKRQQPTQDTSDLSAKLDEQTELLKAILASNVDSQTDARSTAQNSRTFAWAGTAIAILTLVATIISIIAVIQH